MYIRRPRGCGARTQPPFSASGRTAVGRGWRLRMTTPRRSRSGPRGAAAGADVGATLVKLAMRDARGGTSTATLPADALDAVVQRLVDLAPSGLYLTGGG